MAATPRTPQTLIYSTPTRVLGAVTWTLCIFLSVNLILTGTVQAIWGFLPWLLLVGWTIYILLWRPCLQITSDSILVRNILREHTIPFSELTAVRVLQTTSFDTTAGRIPSWGAPSIGKLGPRALTVPHTKVVIQAAWDAWELRQPEMDDGAAASAPHRPTAQPHPPTAVTRRWNVVPVVVGVLSVGLVLASVLS